MTENPFDGNPLEKTPKKSAQTARRERLGRALRDNLHRRKAQARDRAADAGTAGDAPPRRPETGNDPVGLSVAPVSLTSNPNGRVSGSPSPVAVGDNGAGPDRRNG